MDELEYADIDTPEATQKPAKARKAAPKPESTKHLRTLANGAIYDTIKKKIVGNDASLAVRNTQITTETAGALQARGVELKREAMRRAANRVAAQGGSVDGSEMRGDLAFVEAIGEAMTMKALTVNDPKAVDAARFVYLEAGIAERQQTTADIQPNDAIGQALLTLIQHITASSRDIIDGTVSEA